MKRLLTCGMASIHGAPSRGPAGSPLRAVLPILAGRAFVDRGKHSPGRGSLEPVGPELPVERACPCSWAPEAQRSDHARHSLAPPRVFSSFRPRMCSRLPIGRHARAAVPLVPWLASARGRVQGRRVQGVRPRHDRCGRPAPSHRRCGARRTSTARRRAVRATARRLARRPDAPALASGIGSMTRVAGSRGLVGDDRAALAARNLDALCPPCRARRTRLRRTEPIGAISRSATLPAGLCARRPTRRGVRRGRSSGLRGASHGLRIVATVACRAHRSGCPDCRSSRPSTRARASADRVPRRGASPLPPGCLMAGPNLAREVLLDDGGSLVHRNRRPASRAISSAVQPRIASASPQRRRPSGRSWAGVPEERIAIAAVMGQGCRGDNTLAGLSCARPRPR